MSSPQETISVSETVSQETVLDLPQDKKKTRKPKVKQPESFPLEVEEVLANLSLDEFRPGQEVGKEIATVSVMMSKGITVEEVRCGRD